MVLSIFDPVFQPIEDLEGNHYAFEALLRLRGEQNQNPLSFIDDWEKTGFITVADKAMLTAVAGAVDAAGYQPRIAVNVSIVTVENDGDTYRAGLRRLAERTDELIVELTETTEINDLDAVARFAAACKAWGYSVALDDCMPGHIYGSPDFIRGIRPTLIKIDGGFLAKSHQEGHDAGLKQIISVAHQVGARVVAEHISSQALRDYAGAIGADYVQGFAVGYPAPLPDEKPADLFEKYRKTSI